MIVGACWTPFTMFYPGFAIPGPSTFPFFSNLHMYLMCSHIRSCLLNLQFRNSECCILSEKFPTTVLAGPWVVFSSSPLHSFLPPDWLDSGLWVWQCHDSDVDWGTWPLINTQSLCSGLWEEDPVFPSLLTLPQGHLVKSRKQLLLLSGSWLVPNVYLAVLF